MPFPYIPSGGLIHSAFQQFRKSFPSKVDSQTLKKLGIASSNEGSLINILKFIGLLDNENSRTKEGMQLFSTHDDVKFSENLTDILRSSYNNIFELNNDGAWTLSRDALISFFRQSDETSAVTGARQALTFETLASIAGQRTEQVATRATSRPTTHDQRLPKKKAAAADATKNPVASSAVIKEPSQVGLTVRIEINLPANGTQATYDNIFASIRTNLLNDHG